MRLDDERESSHYEVHGSGGRSGGFGMGGGGLFGLLLSLIASRFGLGGIIVALIAVALMNGAPGLLGGGADQGGLSREGFQPRAGAPAGPATLTDVQRFSLKVLGSTERIWGDIYAQAGTRYQPTTLIFYTQSDRSGCGAAQSAMGPFYCPADGRIYLDTDFFRELTQRFGAPGDFAQAYVIAHEVAHHVQDLQGTLAQVSAAQRQLGGPQANALQVKVELQADCYAGVWATRTGLMEAGDMEEGLRAAQAIGDDTLQREAGRRPMPDSFTHGSSEQRMFWLRKGLDSGDPAACDTLASAP
jgi:uncharacterized protein